MLSSAIVGAVALCGSVASAAAVAPHAALVTPAPVLERREAAKDTDPWVSVNDAQEVSTLTPVWTTDDKGSSSLKDAAPYSLTGTVFSMTDMAKPTTTTGDPPNPTPTGKNGAGAFSRCFNADGDHAPFCRPTFNSTLKPGNTYYVTWDPDFYNKTQTNTTFYLTVRLEHLNKTSNEWELLKDYPADRRPASEGYFPFSVTDDLLSGGRSNDITITLQQRVNNTNGEALGKTDPFPVTIADPHYKAHATSGSDMRSLSIALPVVLGAIVLLVVGLCVWNRKTRRIQLGNIRFSRSGTKGYSGRGERRRRMFAGGETDADHDIQLGTGFPDDGPAYRDDMPRGGRPRGDSDGLDSLAGSPTGENFQQQGTTGGGRNAFRDEMDRQQHARRDEF